MPDVGAGLNLSGERHEARGDGRWLFSVFEQKCPIETGDGDRDELDGHQQPAHNRVWGRRRQDKM